MRTDLPWYDPREKLPETGVTCVVLLADFTHETAAWVFDRWNTWHGEVQPIAWQELLGRWSTSRRATEWTEPRPERS